MIQGIVMDANPTEHNKELVRRQADAINARDLEFLAETTSQDFVRHCQATPGLEITNLQGFGEFLQADWASFPDSVLTISQLVAEDDRVAMWATYEATQTGPMGPFPAGGKKMSLDIAGIFR
ncbi:MAG: ester cyclase, partial [Rhodothermia bacterium]